MGIRQRSLESDIQQPACCKIIRCPAGPRFGSGNEKAINSPSQNTFKAVWSVTGVSGETAIQANNNPEVENQNLFGRESL